MSEHSEHIKFDPSLFVDNSPDMVKVRQCKNTLIILGQGITLFTIWSVIKVLGTLFLERSYYLELIREESGPDSSAFIDNIAFVILVIATVIVLLIMVSVRLYVARSAIEEGNGRRRNILYILLAFCIIISNILSLTKMITEYVLFLTDHISDTEYSFISILIEITSMIMVVELIISAIRLRKHQRSIERASDAA
ncbi:hypothetical protein SAMN02910456_00471 [Ruminococcaceae bacterium YRB3002]|nr:hypothetical protein SAMN02910456_00471 [Ruminococcaceae bacterium YRB3002]